MTDLRPLWDIRVRTPRLELRLPTDDELRELFEVAAAGIHPPDEMPFAVAWTDDLREDAFREFHRSAWESWEPDRWQCNFVTFLDGRPIGSQAVEAKDFRESRTVGSGSWLGSAFQGRGFGGEQRAAMLEFAFRGLGAEAAVSGALVHNVRSQRISEKLGYRRSGTSSVSPRGEPIEHFDYRLERGGWTCPIPIELVGVEAVLPLFGVT
jgi:RimJ/RimL family protein N-acetyltransferase